MTARILSIAAAAASIVTAAVAIAAPALASTPATGAGIQAAPVCRADLQPGHSYPLEADGLTPGVQVSNTGTGTENITLAVTTYPGRLPGIRVPSTWVSFGYPKHLMILTSDHLTLGPGARTTVAVTVAIPSGTARGTYVAGLAAVTSTGSGHLRLGAGGGTLLVFTVGIAKPPWTPLQLAPTGNCFSPPFTYEPFQQWAGTAFGAPPGWFWNKAESVWDYSPPAGWVWSWVAGHTGQMYLGGGRPVVECANPAAYPDHQTGQSFIGGQYPDTSTPSGCASWLAASRAGTLQPEPGYDPGHSGHALPRHVQAAAATSNQNRQVQLIGLAGLAVMVVVGGAVALAVRRRAARWGRRSGTRRRWT